MEDKNHYENLMIEKIKSYKPEFTILNFDWYSGVDIAFVKDSKITSMAELKSKIDLKFPESMKRKGWIIEKSKIDKLIQLSKICKVVTYFIIYCKHFNEMYIWQITDVNGNVIVPTFKKERMKMPIRQTMTYIDVYRLQTSDSKILIM